MSGITFGSLFAGIGGFDLGFERAGLRCAWASEIDKNCRTVLDYHWPKVRKRGDVRELGSANLEPVDLVCGGFPCQDVSVAGRREGLDGERSGLWFEFLRIVTELKPKWVVIENVPGLLSSNERRDFATILSGLGNCGYWWAYRILDAQYFGVAQRRRRVFVVGCLGDWRSAAEVLFERESSAWDSAPSREAGESVTGTVKMVSKQGGFRQDVDNVGAYVFEPRYARNGRGAPDDIVPPLKAQSGKGDGAPVVAKVYQEAEYGVAEYDEAGSLRAGRIPEHQMLLRNCGVRRLTPLECERLQGFPDGWTDVDGMSDSARYRMLGNAVAVPVAEWLGHRIMAAHSP